MTQKKIQREKSAAKPAHLQDLASWFFNQGIAVSLDPTSDSLTVPVDDEGLLILWADADESIHFLWPFALEVKPDFRAATLEFLGLLNHRIPLPGFGFNDAEGIVYYRQSQLVPLMDSFEKFELLTDNVVGIAQAYRPLIVKITEGQALREVQAELESGLDE